MGENVIRSRAQLVIAFVVLIGPLPYFYGADSRTIGKRHRSSRPR